MRNQICTTYAKSQKTVETSELFDIFSYSVDFSEEMLLDLKYKNLSSAEMLIVDLFLCGYRKADIRRFGVSTSNLNCVMKGLKEKFKD